jgi:hypothetical protein
LNLKGSFFSRTLLLAASIVLVAIAPATAVDTSTPVSKTKNPATRTLTAQKAKSATTRKRRKSKRTSWRQGQQKVDPQRATEIQEALIREHYLKGTPSGRWDDATQAAMQRYQGANGWQTKTVPDARALIKLGLGPSHDHLLNPESAMTTAPQSRSASSAPTSSQNSVQK